MTSPTPNRTEDEKREPTVEQMAAAWGAWRVRHPTLSMGPGPGFGEAISAALAVDPRASAAEAEIARLTERLLATQHEVTDHGMLAVKANQRTEAAEVEVARMKLRNQQFSYRAEAAEAISEALRERVARLEEALRKLATAEPIAHGLDDGQEFRARRDFARAALNDGGSNAV